MKKIPQEKLFLSGMDARAPQLAREHGLGLELTLFSYAPNLEDAAQLAAAREQMQGISRFWLHAPFAELAPCAIDPMVRQVVLTRFRQTLAVAQQQVVGAGRTDHLGKGRQLHRLVLAMVGYRGCRKGGEHERQRGRGRQQRDDSQLLVQAGALEVRHSDPAGTAERPGAGRRRASFAECKFPQEKNIRSRGRGSVDGCQRRG